ncbi:hypothetical protein VPHK567_0248 [Vibrio phage K567]
MQPIFVGDRLPEVSGEYFCIRFGMSYAPEPIDFHAPDEDDEDDYPRWGDTIPHYGGGGVVPYKELSNREKYFRDNYGRVMYWFEKPEATLSHSQFVEFMLDEMREKNIDPDEVTGVADYRKHEWKL